MTRLRQARHQWHRPSPGTHVTTGYAETCQRTAREYHRLCVLVATPDSEVEAENSLALWSLSCSAWPSAWNRTPSRVS